MTFDMENWGIVCDKRTLNHCMNVIFPSFVNAHVDREYIIHSAKLEVFSHLYPYLANRHKNRPSPADHHDYMRFNIKLEAEFELIREIMNEEILYFETRDKYLLYKKLRWKEERRR